MIQAIYGKRMSDDFDKEGQQRKPYTNGIDFQQIQILTHAYYLFQFLRLIRFNCTLIFNTTRGGWSIYVDCM